MKFKSKNFMALVLCIIFVTSSFGQKMYWTELGSDKIRRANINGSEVEDLISSGLSNPIALSLDLTNSKMYWIDLGSSKIQRSDLDGSNVEDLVTGLNQPRWLTLDLENSKIYWTESGTMKIQKSNLDGSNVEDIVTFSTVNSFLGGIALDLINSKIYFGIYIDSMGGGMMQRANLDGSNVQTIINGILIPRAIKLDLAASKIYWGIDTAATGSIRRANLDGSNVEVIVTAFSATPDLHLDLGNSKMYWPDPFNTGNIFKSDLDGSNTETILTGLSNPYSIALGISDNPLPVEILDFRAFVSEGNVALNWETQSEVENAGFEVYRKSEKEEDFKLISSFKTNTELKGLGTSAQGKIYSFTDENVILGETYFYKLVDVSFNGEKESHNEILITVESQEEFTIQNLKLGQNFPNPFNPETEITYQIPKKSFVTISIFNLQGQLVRELVKKRKAQGTYKVSWDGTDESGNRVSSGIYFYQLKTGNGDFTQTKKMLLLK
ncbi:MAG: T9SS C-terminal target domain-containing protein [Calditrichaeota bacterium]|nr:MAG: T9SS C-terminal target domain-containing protein [Calditrichota bacterium]